MEAWALQVNEFPAKNLLTVSVIISSIDEVIVCKYIPTTKLLLEKCDYKRDDL